ncbi:PQQ-binding-like beta-propeller repeat protein [Halobellus litoreus]|uniref:PQQ-binding-like beta-propeller repeat protein n=1 Tax=Halobellus litoreus TaxID=755310 RepID=A0ABD6DT08_9EURY|nr:PQQ-binding-like beta-propeller repeat protein [Halobellus litoreus]
MATDRTWSRRRLLSGCAGIGSVATAGCLRLTDSSGQTETNEQGGSGTNQQGGSGTTESVGSTPTDDGEQSTASGPASEIELVPAWSGSSSAVTTADGDFFFRPRFTRLRRVRPDGTTVFEAEIADGYLLSISPTFRNGLYADGTGVYVGARARDEVDTGGRVYALDPESGEERWMHEESGDGLHDEISAVTVTDGTVVFASQGSGSGDEQEPLVVGLDAESGEERWRIQFSEGFIHAIVARGDRLFVQQTFGLSIYRLSTRELLEERRLTAGFSQFAAADGTLFVPGETVRALTLPDGDENWSAQTGRSVNTGVGVGETGVFVGTESGYVLGYDRETGDELWENRVAGVVEHPPIVEDGLVWIASERGDLSAFTAEAGELVYEEEIASGFEFTVQDGILNDDERDTAYEIRRG